MQGVIKKGEIFPTHLPKSQLREAFLKRMQLQCRISRGPHVVLRKGQAPVVSISTEKRSGNKRVTKVAGVDAFLVEPDVVSTTPAWLHQGLHPLIVHVCMGGCTSC